MRVLVTGARGKVGRATVAALQATAEDVLQLGWSSCLPKVNAAESNHS